MQESFYVGLDLGSSHCFQSIINSDGALCSARSFPTSEHHLRAAFANLQGDVRVHLARLGAFQLGCFDYSTARFRSCRFSSALACLDRQGFTKRRQS